MDENGSNNQQTPQTHPLETPTTPVDEHGSKTNRIGLIICVFLINLDLILSGVVVLNMKNKPKDTSIPTIAPSAVPTNVLTPTVSQVTTTVPTAKAGTTIPTQKPTVTPITKTSAAPTTQNPTATPSPYPTATPTPADKIPPTITNIRGPEEGSTVSLSGGQTCIPIQVSDNVDSFSGLLSRTRINGGEWTAWTSSHEFCVVLPPGPVIMNYELRDQAGNLTTATRSFTNQ